MIIWEIAPKCVTFIFQNGYFRFFLFVLHFKTFVERLFHFQHSSKICLTKIPNPKGNLKRGKSIETDKCKRHLSPKHAKNNCYENIFIKSNKLK